RRRRRRGEGLRAAAAEASAATGAGIGIGHREGQHRRHGAKRKQRTNAQGKHGNPPRKTRLVPPNIGIPWRYCKRCRMVSQTRTCPLATPPEGGVALRL